MQLSDVSVNKYENLLYLKKHESFLQSLLYIFGDSCKKKFRAGTFWHGLLSNHEHKYFFGLSPEPWLQFSQTWPHFNQNHKLNPIKSSNLKNFIEIEVWVMEIKFGSLGPKRRTKPYAQSTSSNIHKHHLILSRIMSWIQRSHQIW